MTEKNYVVNVKTAKGTIVTVRGDSAKELDANLDAYIDGGLSAKIAMLENDVVSGGNDAVAQVSAALGATVVSETSTSFAPVPPPVAQAPAGVGGKSCVHGPMVKRTGVGAKGEWRAHFCPTPKGTADQCAPAFAPRGSAEWNSFQEVKLLEKYN